MTSIHLSFICLLSVALAWVWAFMLIMRRIALYGLFVLLAGTTHAATYRLTGQQVTATLPDGGMNWYVLVYNTSHQIIGEASWSPYSGAVTRTGTLSAADRSQDFYVVIAGAFNNYNSPSLTKIAWYSAYEVGGTEPQASTFGGFNNGSPVSLSGAPADPLLGTNTPPKYWREVVDLEAPPAGQPSLRYQIVVTNQATSQVIGRHVVVVPPGPTAQVVLYYNVQFTYTVQATQQVKTSAGENGWMPTGPVLKSGTGDPEINDPPVGAFPEGLGPMGTPASGGGSMAGGSTGNGTTLPNTDTTKVANEARTGTPDPNEEARQRELRGEIQRGTNQTKASGESIVGAVGEAAEKITGAIKAGNGSAQGTSTGSGIDQGGAVGVADTGVVAFLGSIPGRITALGTALGNLRAAAGLGAVGTTPPSWQFNYGSHSATLSLANYDFSMVRAIALFATGLAAIWQAVGIIRGTFADEGK